MAEKETAARAGAGDKTAARADLPAAAKRALAEAAARRRQALLPAAESGKPAGSGIAAGAEQTAGKRAEADNAAAPPAQPKELGGRREGRDPTRYGDWEFKGRAIDF